MLGCYALLGSLMLDWFVGLLVGLGWVGWIVLGWLGEWICWFEMLVGSVAWLLAWFRPMGCVCFVCFSVFVVFVWVGWLWGFGFGADVYLWASLEVWRMWDGRWGGMIGGWRMADDRWGGWRMWDEYLGWMIGRVGKP